MRKRRLWILLLLVLLAAGGLWLFGRAPSRYALEQVCRRYQDERMREEHRFQRESGQLLADGRAEDLPALRAAHERYLLGHKRLEMGGWTVLLVPPGATPPAVAGFHRAAGHDPSLPDDAPHLRGEMEIWLAPRGLLARAVAWLGLSP